MTSSSMLKSRRALSLSAEPNVIPFIDVLLVLLIIFMVTAPKPTTDINVDTVRRHGEAVSAARPTIVSLVNDGGSVRIEIDGERVAYGAIAPVVFEHARANNPMAIDIQREARIVVRADLEVSYESVVGVMDVLRVARFAQIGVYAQEA